MTYKSMSIDPAQRESIMHALSDPGVHSMMEQLEAARELDDEREVILGHLKERCTELGADHSQVIILWVATHRQGGLPTLGGGDTHTGSVPSAPV